ncbi:MAG: hypothetical protein ACJ76H_14045 [Bacteriovoracaceae bacterium]
MKKQLNFLILCFMLLAVTACGDLLGTKVIKKEIDTTRFRADCELELDAFKHILHQNISSQIRCLGANLNLFIKIVETNKPGYMNVDAFEAFLRKNQTGITPDMLKALKQVWELNWLIRGEDKKYISKENVDDVIALAIVFNEQMALNFGPIFESEQEATYTLHRIHQGRVKDAANKIMIALKNTFRVNRGGRIDTLDIIKLLEAFTTKDSDEVIQKLKKVLFVKKVLMGGQSTIITHEELYRFMFSFPYLAQIGLDAVRYEHILLDQKSIVALLKLDIENLSGIVLNPKLGDRDREYFFSLEDLYETIRMFVPKDTLDIDKFKKLVVYGKKIIMGGNGKDVYGADFKNLLYHTDNILLQGQLFHQMYDKYRVLLESKQPVTINFNQAITAFPEYPNQLKKFIRIVQNYRFLKGEFESAFYTREWRRNADAVFEIGMIEYVLDLIARFEDPEELTDGKPTAWGTKFPYTGTVFTHAIDQFQLQKILNRVKHELIKLDLILPHTAISTSDTISLLGTLFQYQSDENINPNTKKGLPILDVNEATEFAVSLMQGIGLASDMMKKFKVACDADMDHYDRISPACFRKNFLKFVCQDYRQYYPLLFDSLGLAANSCDVPNSDYNLAYLDMTIKAARNCNYYEDDNHKPTEEIYYSEADVMSLLVEMYHVEATFLRWDKNKNNLLDVDEVEDAYRIYSWALDGFLVDKPSYIKMFKKQIYQYMIKFEEVPDEKDPKSIGRFLKFLVSFNKKSPATRKTFSAVLWGISEQNKKIRIANGTETFQCNWLKNPDTIPPEDDKEDEPSPSVNPDAAPGYSTLLKLVDVKGDLDSENVQFTLKKGCVNQNGESFCIDENYDQEDTAEDPLSKPHKFFCLNLGFKQICL